MRAWRRAPCRVIVGSNRYIKYYACTPEGTCCNGLMPRKIRVQYPGAIYHVTSRGDRGEDVFLDDVDRQDFLKTLAEACQKTGWQLHAYECQSPAPRVDAKSMSGCWHAIREVSRAKPN